MGRVAASGSSLGLERVGRAGRALKRTGDRHAAQRRGAKVSVAQDHQPAPAVGYVGVGPIHRHAPGQARRAIVARFDRELGV